MRWRGAQAGKNAVENNYLSSTEARQLDKELSDCKASGNDCKSVVEKYIEISNKKIAKNWLMHVLVVALLA